jgi:hypothetical protein
MTTNTEAATPSRQQLPLRVPGDTLSRRTLEIAEHGWDAFVRRHAPDPDEEAEATEAER